MSTTYCAFRCLLSRPDDIISERKIIKAGKRFLIDGLASLFDLHVLRASMYLTTESWTSAGSSLVERILGKTVFFLPKLSLSRSDCSRSSSIKPRRFTSDQELHKYSRMCVL